MTTGTCRLKMCKRKTQVPTSVKVGGVHLCIYTYLCIYIDTIILIDASFLFSLSPVPLRVTVSTDADMSLSFVLNVIGT